MSQLNKKEKAFCRKYLETGNIAEALRASGYKKDPYELLCSDEAVEEIKRLSGALNRNAESIAKSALIRLAVGDVSEVASLVFSDEPDKRISDADMFMVSEIKKKGDLTEVKFFDRFKAIKTLLEGIEIDTDVPFYNALLEGAEKLDGDYGD